MTKYLLLIIATLTLASGVLGMQLKSQIKTNGILQQQREQLEQSLADAETTNQTLVTTIDKIASDNAGLLDQIAIAESDKRQIANDLEALNAQINDGLNAGPVMDWAKVSVPDPIAVPVNAALDRLRHSTSPQGNNQSKGAEVTPAGHLVAGLHAIPTPRSSYHF